VHDKAVRFSVSPIQKYKLLLTYAEGKCKNTSRLCAEIGEELSFASVSLQLDNPRNRKLQCIFIQRLDINLAAIKDVGPSSLEERHQRFGGIIFNIHHGGRLRCQCSGIFVTLLRSSTLFRPFSVITSMSSKSNVGWNKKFKTAFDQYM
jgi:hypothetical protein